jgi:S1-C subfamily serine protease
MVWALAGGSLVTLLFLAGALLKPAGEFGATEASARGNAAAPVLATGHNEGITAKDRLPPAKAHAGGLSDANTAPKQDLRADSNNPSAVKGGSGPTPEELYALASPGVLAITLKNDDGGTVATGSGFLLQDELVHDPDARRHHELAEYMTKTQGQAQQFAYLLTNYHVIEAAVTADLVLSDGAKAAAMEIVSEDETADLALLSILVLSSKPLTRIRLAGNAPRVGASVYAIGSPRGLVNHACICSSG